MPQAAASPISGRPQARRAARRGRRSFDAYYRSVDDALRHRADGHRLLDSPWLGLTGVQRLARRRFRRSVVADVHATRALVQQATERASTIRTPRQGLGPPRDNRWPPSRHSSASAAASIAGRPTGDRQWKP